MVPTTNQLRLINPPFDSSVTDLIIQIDYLRRKPLYGSTHPRIFFQIKNIFHILESLGSARIEGNHTTIAEYIETEIEESGSGKENILEIKNNEKALSFIEENIESTLINRAFISELHKIVVNGLSREGSRSPGFFRESNLRIAGSEHTPPDALHVPVLMDDFFAFLQRQDPEKYDLIKIAIAHHRFAWIHPFDNGNGRTVRLITYAMMIKMGFKVDKGRILNPTAVFCSDRDEYYNALAQADKGTDEGLLVWIEYMLRGLKVEIEKIDRLLESDFISSKILIPALKNAYEKRIINDNELKILSLAVQKQEFKTAQLSAIFPGKSSVDKSRVVGRLREKKFLIPITEGARTYIPNFLGNELMRVVMKSLDQEGFLPLRGEV